MNIEQRLAEAIRSFGLDALAGAVPFNVDLDVVLSVTGPHRLRRAPPPHLLHAPSSSPCSASATWRASSALWPNGSAAYRRRPARAGVGHRNPARRLRRWGRRYAGRVT